MLSPDSFRAERCCDMRPSPKTVSFAAISFHSSTGSILSQADLRPISTLVRPIFAGPNEVSILYAILYRQPRAGGLAFLRDKVVQFVNRPAAHHGPLI